MKPDPVVRPLAWHHHARCDCPTCAPPPPAGDRLTHRHLGLLTAAGVATGLGIAFLHDAHAAAAALAATVGIIL